jgi:hypothetical protein
LFSSLEPYFELRAVVFKTKASHLRGMPPQAQSCHCGEGLIVMEAMLLLSSWRSCFEFGAIIFKTMTLCLRGSVVVEMAASLSSRRSCFKLRAIVFKTRALCLREMLPRAQSRRLCDEVVAMERDLLWWRWRCRFQAGGLVSSPGPSSL